MKCHLTREIVIPAGTVVEIAPARVTGLTRLKDVVFIDGLDGTPLDAVRQDRGAYSAIVYFTPHNILERD